MTTISSERAPHGDGAHPRPLSTGEPGDTITLRSIGPGEHAAVADEWGLSFLQVPEWAAVKQGWRAESLGWFDGERLLGVALVLYRPVPGTRRSLAYVPEGPALPWRHVAAHPDRWLDPFVAHLRARGAFAIRIGPPVPLREWEPSTAKAGLACEDVRRLGGLPPDVEHAAGRSVVDVLRAQGWRRADAGVHERSDAPRRDGQGGKDGNAGQDGHSEGFGTGQPRFTVRLPLSGRSVPELLAGTNQQWRRNVAKSAREEVVVREGSIDDLPVFHALYRETAGRDGFTPRPAPYFTGMWGALNGGTRPRLRLYLAELAGEGALAAALTVQVGDTCWYSYGASSARRRDVQASTAVQWRAITDAHSAGCAVYDLRGITDTLDPSAPLSGLLRFKLATGGSCVESVGEWELVLSRMWDTAFRAYLYLRS